MQSLPNERAQELPDASAVHGGASSATDLSGSVTELPLVSVGDAFDYLPRLAPASVDCVITSPPYWGLRSYGHDHDETVLDSWKACDLAAAQPFGPDYAWYRAAGGVLGLEPYPDWYIRHLVEILDLSKAALKPGGSLWVNVGDTYFARWSSMREDGRQGYGQPTRARRKTPTGGYLHDKQLLMLPARFAIAMQDSGWILRNDVIWSKSATPPRPEKDRLRLTHESPSFYPSRASPG